MSYTYTPNDIAVFLLLADLPIQKEQIVLRVLWEREKPHFSSGYQSNETLFKRHVHSELSAYCSGDALDKLVLFLSDSGDKFQALSPEFEQSIIWHYFKVVRLELSYIEGKDYHKIKLRRLFKQFGYKRRSSALLQNIQSVLDELSLQTHLKGRISCNIADVDIDDMIMIRLK